LLRALEEGQIQRLGEEHRRPVDVRVIAATNRDLALMAERKQFRLDLYHRLAVGIIRLPPLRERREDIPLLIAHILRSLAKEGQGPQQAPAMLSPEAIELLQARAWPGNFRELRNVLERALTVSGGVLQVSDLELSDYSSGVYDGYIRYEGRTFKEICREVFVQILQKHDWNCTAAAKSLGIAKSTFYDQLKAMGVKRPMVFES
jgi:two-component system response regulator AtoC